MTVKLLCKTIDSNCSQFSKQPRLIEYTLFCILNDEKVFSEKAFVPKNVTFDGIKSGSKEKHLEKQFSPIFSTVSGISTLGNNLLLWKNLDGISVICDGNLTDVI